MRAGPVAAPPVVPLLRRQSRLDRQLHRQAIRTAAAHLVRDQQVLLQMDRSKKVNPGEERQKLLHRRQRRRRPRPRFRLRRLRRRRALYPVCCRDPILFLLLKNSSDLCWGTESGIDRGPGSEPAADEAAGVGIVLEVGAGRGERVRGERVEHLHLVLLNFDAQFGRDNVVVVAAVAAIVLQCLILCRL